VTLLGIEQLAKVDIETLAAAFAPSVQHYIDPWAFGPAEEGPPSWAIRRDRLASERYIRSHVSRT
jgi:hypothetical protein